MINVYEFRNEPKLAQNLSDLHAAWSKERPFWSIEEIKASLVSQVNIPNTRCFYLASDPQNFWQGFCLLQDNGPVVELLYIYCLPSIRGQNLAQKLLRGSLNSLSQTKADVILEVRTSNISAQKFYEKLGFKNIGQRKKYYADGEDALTYQWTRS